MKRLFFFWVWFDNAQRSKHRFRSQKDALSVAKNNGGELWIGDKDKPLYKLTHFT